MKKANIYIVEDDRINAVFLKRILEDYGYEVIGISIKGEEAVESVQRVMPDLIFMDILPGGELDGIAPARKISGGIDVPVVYIIAVSDGPAIKELPGTFPFGYILKPFEREQIYIAVEIALYKHNIEKKLKQEIEERKKAEETLREIEKSLHEAYKLAHIGAWDWKVDTDTVTWTEELYRIAGLDPMVPAPTYAEHSTIYTPESWKRLKTAFERAMETGESYQLMLELIRPDGSTQYVNAYGGVKHDTNGRVNGLYGIVQDITERKRSEDKVTKHNKILQEINEHAMELSYLQYDEMFTHVVKKLKAIFNVKAAWVSEYDEKTSDLVIKSTSLTDEENSWAMKKLGRKMPGYRVHVDDEQYRMMTNNTVGSLSSLCELSFGAISEIIGKSIEKVFGIGWFMPVALMNKDKIAGTVVIAGDPGQDAPDREEILAFAAITANIIERKKAEQQLKETSALFELVFNMNPDASLITRLNDGCIVYVNDGYTKMSGFLREDAVGKSALAIDLWEHPADRQNIIDELQEKGFCSNYEAIFKRKDGSRFDGLLSASIFNYQGIPHAITVTRDITERKRAEDELKKSTQLLRDTGEMAQVGGWELDLSTREVVWTEETCRIHGVDPGYKANLEEAVNFFAPESRPSLEEALKKAMETGKPFDLESLFIPKGSKEMIWVRSLGRAVYSGGKIVKLAGTFQNIDKYIRAREELRQSEERFRGIVENANVGYFFVDTEGYYRDVNRAWLDMHVYDSADEVIGKSFSITQVPLELEAATALGKKVMDGTPIRDGEFTRLRKDGSVGHHIYSSRPVTKDGSVIGIEGFMVDITERIKAELDVQSLSRHLLSIQEEERQRVARDLHDSVGQTVLAAKLNIEAYQKNKSDRERLGKGLSFLDRASQELRSIYTGLYPSILEDLGLEAAVRWYAKHFLEANGISASLDIALDREINQGMAVNLYRIIQEVLSNVMKHSGADSVRLEMHEKGGVITVTVQDQGIGFDEKAIGLDKFGLSNLRYRVRLLGGECRIDSKEGEGTTIIMTAMRAAP